MIKFDFSTYMPKFESLDSYKEKINKIKNILEKETSMLDWYSIDKCIDEKTLKDILLTSKRIRSNCDVFIVIGIGGSFLGAKSVIDSLSSYFSNKKPEIIFAGTFISLEYLEELWKHISDKRIAINVISKSGTTLETNIAFDYLYAKMKKKYNEKELKERIIVTTDKEVGSLRKLVKDKGYKSYIVPENIGGRYSVLTAVGLFPIAVAGYNIEELLKGAREVNKKEAFKYAIIRDILYRKNKTIESFTIYEPKLYYFTEWLKQLFAETQGKDNKGILPVSVINTRDLHSLGQFYQEGSKFIFETVIDVKGKEDSNWLSSFNNIAAVQVAKAHFKAETYSNFIKIDKLDEYHLGYLIYFFELSAAIGGYLLDINPFDQPGVSEYKKLLNQEIKKYYNKK